MAKYDFRILLESVEGKKLSYVSSSFVDTSDNLVLSSSQVYNRITAFSGSNQKWEYLDTKATASLAFNQSASNNSKIHITSSDGTSRTYVALSSSINGSVSPSGSTFIQFATGSRNTVSTGSDGTNPSSSAASNLLAAITSSNGHGNKFTVSQGTLASTSASGFISLTQSINIMDSSTAVNDGRTTLSYSNNIHLSLADSASAFGGGWNRNYPFNNDGMVSCSFQNQPKFSGTILPKASGSTKFNRQLTLNPLS